MNVKVKLFAAARELTGRGEIEIDLPGGATVAQLRETLCDSQPELAPLAARSMVAVNEEYGAETAVLREGDVVALIPPVSGG